MTHTLIIAFFDADKWEECKGGLENQILPKVKNHYVEIAFGAWAFKTREAFPAIQDLMSFLKRHGVQHVVIPLSEPLQCCVEAAIAEALEKKIDLPIYNAADK